MCDFSRRRNVYGQSMSRSSGGRLFHTIGPAEHVIFYFPWPRDGKARLPSFDLFLTVTVTADLVVDDLSRLFAESDSVSVTMF